MQQKSWPSGAPQAAAAASIAVMPGRTSTSISFHESGAFSITSKTAAAIAKTPGSPELTITTCFPVNASSNAWCTRSSSTLLSEG